MLRSPSTELLDSDAGTPEEIAASLGDLRRVNRWFGGISTMAWLVKRVAEATGVRELSFLDVAGGSGDITQGLQVKLQQSALRVHTVVLDRLWSHLQPPNGTKPGIRVVAEAGSLPFADGSFDLVGSSLFVHHLNPEAVVDFMNEALRVASRAVLVNDLRRGRFHLALVYAGMPLYRSRLTRNDAPASVRQAYTMAELDELLRLTSAARVEVHPRFLCRMGAIAWKCAGDNAPRQAAT
jgi:ubiquinone/menaquinone biosynthesis C-methylase UbiE